MILFMYRVAGSDESIFIANHNVPPCNFISKISSKNNRIQIHFQKRFNKYANPYRLAHYFSFITKAFNQTIAFPPQSILNPIFLDNQRTLEISLPFPFITNYTVDLLCHDFYDVLNEKTLNKLQKQNQQKFHTYVNLDEFQKDIYTSQLKCYGTTYEQRVCEASNITLHSNSIVFTSPAFFTFPKHFLNLGSRHPLFEFETEEMSTISYVKNNDFMKEVADFVPKEKFIFIYSESKNGNDQTSFNRMTDLYYAIYKTKQQFKNLKLSNEENDIYFLDFANTFEHNYYLLKILKNGPNHLQNNKFDVLVEHSLIGLTKIDSNNKIQQYFDQFSEQNFLIDKDFVNFMQNTFLDKEENKNDKEIEISIVNPKYPPQQIENLTKCETLVQTICHQYRKTCKVNYFEYPISSHKKALNTIHRSNILITRAFLGSELSIFMKKGNHIISVYPDFINCDKRSQKLADLAEIHYHRLESMYIYIPDPDICGSKQSHTISMNDPIALFLEPLNNKLRDIISTL